MPRKIRQLKADFLWKAGFVELPDRGKGSHSVWAHATLGGRSLTIAGNDGDDAREYLEKQVRQAIARTHTPDLSYREQSMATQHTYDNVAKEELDLAQRYPMHMERSPEADAFIVSFPDAPGVKTHGATRVEAAEMGEDAIITWLTAMIDSDRPILPPSPYAGSETDERLPPFSGDRVMKLRGSFDVSQEEFARLLNLSVATVRAWEQGVSPPDGAAARLLSIAERHPETIMEAASVSKPLRDRVA